MTFSVIIPAYNASRYIARCIESVKAQAFTDFECIIVNDGSTDDTLEVCRSLTADDARFVLIDIPNGGVSNARNKGLERVTGDYVLFIDADDWVEPTLLQELSQQCKGVDVVQFDYYEVGSDTKQEIHVDSDLAMIVRGDGAVVWKRAYRREIVADLRFDTTIKAGEDYLFSTQVFLRCQSYRHIDRCLYNYYVANEQSAMHSNFAENFGYQLLATSKVERMLMERGLYEVHKGDLRMRHYWCIREQSWRWLMQNMPPGRKRKLTMKWLNSLLKRGYK